MTPGGNHNGVIGALADNWTAAWQATTADSGGGYLIPDRDMSHSSAKG